MHIPCLFITYNRLEFVKKTLPALLQCDEILPYVYDNASSDGTSEWLKSLTFTSKRPSIYFSNSNDGISGAMNFFLDRTTYYGVVAKVDSDTIVPKDFVARMRPHLQKADIIQARHHILRETHPGGFDAWVKTMTQDGDLRFNHFVGGSGILFNRNKVNGPIPIVHDPKTKKVQHLMGWRKYQADHPELKKAFATNVTIELLDTDKNGAKYPKEYEQYYRQVGRIK